MGKTLDLIILGFCFLHLCFCQGQMKTEYQINKEMGRVGSDMIPRSGVPTTATLWQSASGSIEIPYYIDTSYDTTQTAQINNAITIMNAALTCSGAKWRPRMAGDTHFAHFTMGGGCSSYVGRVSGTTETIFNAGTLQTIVLAPGCLSASGGVILHEMLHAMGFDHEQSRTDRDMHVNINMANIDPAPGNADQFTILTSMHPASLQTPYDYGSIMHYGATDFGVELTPGVPEVVITTIPPNIPIGQRNGLSDIDIWEMNAVYGCMTAVTTTTTTPTTPTDSTTSTTSTTTTTTTTTTLSTDSTSTTSTASTDSTTSTTVSTDSTTSTTTASTDSTTSTTVSTTTTTIITPAAFLQLLIALIAALIQARRGSALSGLAILEAQPTMPLSFTDAQAFCQAQMPSATVGTIQSLAENVFISNELMASGMIWIGLLNDVTNMKYHWADGSKSAYRRWCSGSQPTNVADQCVVLDMTNLINGQGCFDVVPCITPMLFYCERRSLQRKDFNKYVQVIQKELKGISASCKSCRKSK